jgi:membrane protease YdiL (CAAX protease family)
MQVIRRRWKRILAFAAVWVLALFPIPVLPLWGVSINEQALQAIVIIVAVISIPMFLLAVFMK